MLNYNSLAFKNAIIYLILFLAGIGLTGFLLLQNSSKEIIRSSEKNLVHSSDLIQIKFSTYLSDLRNDLTHISKSPFLHAYLDSNSDYFKQLINQEYQSLLSSKTDYFQIRFIGIEENGREIIRVERYNDSIRIVEGQDLQNKGGRDYFLETKILEKDSMYISPINLNREHDTLSRPYTPTLRVAYPVYHADSLEGILIINADLRILFASLRQVLDEKARLIMLNHDGYYLMHENPEKQFGFEFGRPGTFVEEFGQSVENIVENYNHVFLSQGKLHYVEQLSFPKEDYKIYIIVSADKQELLFAYYSWRRQSFFIIGALVLTFMFLAFIYMNKQSAELKDITNKLKLFPQKLAVSDLPIHRKDEIGDLAKSFKDMSQVVSENIHSLNQAKLEAEQAVKEKIEFMENMSHEIRNPLQSISGLSEILEKNAPAPHQQKIIKSLRFNTSNLRNLVNDILDYKRLIRGDFKLNEEWVSLDELMDEIHGSHNYLAVTKKIKFKLSINKNLLHKEIFIDKTRINQILHNLILNALKFTSAQGNVKLGVQLISIEDQNYKIQFSVKDSGIGMDQSTIQQIKKRYFTKTSQPGNNEGFGLGLSIVVQILNHLKSELSIKSEAGLGSEFSFDLNVRTRSFEKGAQEKPIDFKLNVLKKLNILAIDDDEQILELYDHLFEDKTNHFYGVKSPLILAEPKFPKFDIILSDYQLKGNFLNKFKSELQLVSHSKTLLYLVSAQHDIKPTVDFGIPLHTIIQKPFVGEKIMRKICVDYLSQEYGVPDIRSIQKDYDYDVSKIANALHLLIREWQTIMIKVSHSIHSQDQDTYRQLVHKMITSVRRLGLIQFETLLNRIDSEFNQNQVQKYVPIIQECMLFYLDEIHKFVEET